MAELKDAADQFAKDLIGQNITGLMMVFTPNGMTQAMAMQQQMASSGQGQRQNTGYEIQLNGEQGDAYLVDIVMKSNEGDGVIQTRWKDVAGAWKVDDISLKA
jgi:hypothetical protein